ncbi:MAG: hypothetical protein NVSMB47_08780 [Polyangiales bacterium]
MGLGAGIWLIVLGILGAASLIIAKRPDAKEAIGKLAPYQGWIGASSVLWGLWIAIWCVLNMGILTSWSVIGFATYLAVAFVLVALGLLLGVGVLKTFTKSEQAHAKMDQTITKLAPFQGTLGLIAIGLGVWDIITNFIF